MKPWFKPGYVVLWILLLLPVLLALPRLITLWDGGWVSALRVLGIGTGILGTSMLLISAALSIRLPKLDQIWGGLPQIWGGAPSTRFWRLRTHYGACVAAGFCRSTR